LSAIGYLLAIATAAPAAPDTFDAFQQRAPVFSGVSHSTPAELELCMWKSLTTTGLTEIVHGPNMVLITVWIGAGSGLVDSVLIRPDGSNSSVEIRARGSLSGLWEKKAKEAVNACLTPVAG
jgi:hypothetical protein